MRKGNSAEIKGVPTQDRPDYPVREVKSMEKMQAGVAGAKIFFFCDRPRDPFSWLVRGALP